MFHALNAPEEMAQMGRASPRHLSSGSWRAIRPTSTQIRQLATAFTAGALLAFLLTSWSARSGFPSLHTQPHPGLSVCDMPKAQGIALSPLALANMTGSATFIPDKLIVAARHHEVRLLGTAVTACIWCLAPWRAMHAYYCVMS